jgi:hypothetical protein
MACQIASPDLAAELAALARAACEEDATLDLGDITYFEHINLIVGNLRCVMVAAT